MTSIPSTIGIQTLEAYLFTENKQEFLNKLLPGTEAYTFFSLLHKIHTSPTITKEIEEEISNSKKYLKSTHSKAFELRAFLKRFDTTQDENTRKTIIKDIITHHFNHMYFEYSKPINIVTSSLDTSTTVLPSTLKEDYLLESRLSRCYTDLYAFDNLHDNVLTRLDTKKLQTVEDLRIFDSFIRRANPVDFEDFPQLLHEYGKRKRWNAYDFASYSETLTLEQLRKLGELNKELLDDFSYVESLCKKEFRTESLDTLGKDLPKHEVRELLLKLKNWCAQRRVLNSVVSCALYQILQIDLELNRFDRGLFLEYLKSPIRPYSSMSTKLHLPPKYREYNFGTEKIPQDTLIKEYLEHFFQSAESISPFNEFFESSFLQTLFYSTKLMLGQTLQAKDALTPEQIKKLIETKELKICRYNPTYFKGNDPVVITLSLKNVSSLMIKVFEFKPENFYRKERRQLDASINLDGLIAAEELNVELNEPPAKRYTREFTFESIAKKSQGIFIVDFIGSGLCSRSVIRKGKLSFIERQTVAGQLFTIVDQDTNICTGPSTGMWIREKFYQANEKGEVLVPFLSNESVKTILVHNEYAELVDLQLKYESLEFRCSYIYNYESFIMGNKALVLVQPRLFLNQQPIGLDLIQSCSADVIITSEDNVPTTISFEKLKLSSSEDTELEFPVPAKLRFITIQVKANIIPMHKKEPKEYTNSHMISLDSYQGTQQFCDMFLRSTQSGYELFVLGKNGEPKTGLVVDLHLTSKYLRSENYVSLQTNAEGKISLGKLEEVTQVRANLKAIGDITSISRSWSVNQLKSLNYPESISICEGDHVTLPLLHNELNRHKIAFKEILNNGKILRNCLNGLKIENKKLIISGLTEGSYSLYLKDVKKTIPIAVYRGTYWTKNPNYLWTKDTLIDIKRDINNIVITDFKVEPKANSEVADVRIQAFADAPQFTRFHVFGTQFLESNPNRTVNELDNKLSEWTSEDTFLGLRQSQYLNNRSLGDEYCYVLDRKSQPRHIGNSLEKPKILLKKTFVQETHTKQEQLAQAKDFSAAPPKEEERKKKAGAKAYRERASSPRSYHPGSVGQEAIHGFLVNPCIVAHNLKLDDQGGIVLKDFPIKKFSSLFVVASNLTANVCESFPLESNKFATRDLTQKARSENAVFSINRVGVNSSAGQKVQIKDLSSSKYQIVDSVGKLFEIQKNLASFSGTINNGKVNYDSWSFLKDWEGLKWEEKLEKYDKFASHELNLFVYFKDREFFTRVVQPFIQNKIEKTLVDYFLIDDERKILEAAQVGVFLTLNSLEKILVILKLQTVDQERAKKLVTSLEQQNSLKKIDINTFKKYFDLVLASKNAEEEEEQRLFVGGGMQPVPTQAMYSQQQYLGPPSQAFPVQQMMSNFAYPSASNYAMPSQVNPQLDLLGFAPQQTQMQFQQQAQVLHAQSYNRQVNTFGASRNAPSMDLLFDEAPRARGAAIDPLEEQRFMEKRAQVQSGYQELEKTKEYCERQYYEKRGNLEIELNNFWVDLAKHIVSTDAKKPFLTQNFIYAHFSHTEMIAVLAFMSLPFKSGSHTYNSYEGRGIEIVVGSDSVVFTKAVTEAQSDLGNEVMVMQKFFDLNDRYTESEDEPGFQIEREVDQYITDKIYGSTVIVTNLSASRQQIQALVEIPEGAIPIQNLDYTKFHNIILESYATRTLECYFYFPKTGKFKTNPPNVSKKGKVLAVGKSINFEVKLEKTYQTLETLDAVLTTGSQDDVLNFVRTKNIWNPKIFDFNAIYWLLKDKKFFSALIEILRERNMFNSVVWQFGFYHQDVQTIKEYLSQERDNFSSEISYLSSSLFTVDKYKLLEYSPLINQRVHLLASEKNRILNKQLETQYSKYLLYMCERGTFEAKHYLGLVYYLLAQDRVDEAIRFFGKIDKEEVEKNKLYQLQYDYFYAYIDFVIGYPKFPVAREICKKYIDYPVLSWRSMFIDIANQLAEFDAEDAMEIEQEGEEDTVKQNFANAEKEEVVNMEVIQNKLHINYQNVEKITLAFYRVDLEVLFSRSPFITKEKDEFSYIQPNETQQLQIENSKSLEKIVFEIPQRLQKYNLYIELRTPNKSLYETFFSTSLQVHVIESFGQVKVLDLENKPLTKVYVKCFAKVKGSEDPVFYKDGYTDLRGRFDYATLNSNNISNITKFAIFVSSDELGSLVKEVRAPEKLGRVENHSLHNVKVKKLLKK